MQERTRLYVSPLTPELLPTVLAPSVLPTASNISFHSLQTFPERNYGYIELPFMEAAKVKKKLHGSILKGSKMKVEDARPKEKMERDAENEELEAEAVRKAERVGRKRKREEGVIPGVELPRERKVKRGWTEPAGSSKTGKVKATTKGSKDKGSKKVKPQTSLFSDESECIFRAKVPPNTAAVPKQSADEGKDASKKKKSRSTGEVLVHEFSNTTKHASFLRDDHATNGKNATFEFVEGQGWIDREGNIVEPPPKEQQSKAAPKTRAVEDRQLRSKKASNVQELFDGVGHEDTVDLADPDETSSSGTSSSPSEDESAASESGEHIKASIVSNGSRENDVGNESDATSSSGSSTSSVDTEAKRALPGQTAASTETPSSEIHPLEAIFKKPRLASSDSPRKPALEVRTSFSFFEPDDKNDDSTNRVIPQTPFTRRDLQHRSMRSAAPTPDTAAPNKTSFGNLWGRDGEIESDDDGPDDHENADKQGEASNTPLASKKTSKEAPGEEMPQESDFSKWFWEHRGETNRAWKKRKRDAAKEKRQKDNKSRGKSAD